MTLSLPAVPGPMPMPRAPVGFMIACAARTGSTMLVRTLRSHPGLVVHGEVWGDGMVGRGQRNHPIVRLMGRGQPLKPVNDLLMELVTPHGQP